MMKRVLVFVFTSWAVLHVRAQSFSEVTNLLDSPTVGVFAVGTSIIDVNSDGLLDLYRFQGTFLQQPDGSFLESSGDIGFKNEDGSTAEGSTVFGAIFGDYDNDGYVDAFFEDLTAGSRLFRNRGDGSFYQANQETGIEIFSALQGSVWADFDNDGLLDLFVGGDGDPSGLFLNNGDDTFENASANVGYSPFRNVYGVAAADFDNDGDIDIYLSSCSQFAAASRNMLFRNDGQAGFTDIAPSLGLDDDRGGWAVVWADVNNDGWLDLFVANQPVSGAGIESRPGFNRMYINDGAGGFTDMAP
ncbi:MAG: VCBS repeat-containing protein, partial [Rhodothermales bacterium]|nr:VCBS repeat-containing protein [Rhodothermales bacterium]